jgi:hypothetical protein
MTSTRRITDAEERDGGRVQKMERSPVLMDQ